MRRILSLEEGVQETVTKIEAVKERPVLVSIYGLPNSGKTFLIGLLGDYFDSRGSFTARFGGAASEEEFERVLRYGGKDMVCLFHCAWERYTDHPLMILPCDPNKLAKDIAGKKVDLNIGIFNPNIYRTPKGDYDFIISNKDAKIKPPIGRRI